MDSTRHSQQCVRDSHRLQRTLRTALGLTAACVVTASAYAAINQTIAVGSMDHAKIIGGPATVTMRTLTIAPGEVLSWHYHPGAGAYTVVITGTLRIEDGCGGETVYTVGQAFLEAPLRVHRGKNLTTENVVTAQTFIVPAGSPTTVQTGGPLCGVPLEVYECAGGGWQSFNYPRSFSSRGDCVSYVITRRLEALGLPGR